MDAEQEIENSHKLTRSQNEELLCYEFKQAELATLDTALLKVKVKDFENSLAGKERIIDLLKNKKNFHSKKSHSFVKITRTLIHLIHLSQQNQKSFHPH